MKQAVKIREYLKPGDLGYLIYLHAKLYYDECQYDLEFEGYVCKTFHEFVERHSEALDRFFIAESDGKIVGNVAILGHSAEEAQLRWFLIDPSFRGTGLGRKLFEHAMRFCRERGFKNVWLLTTSDQEKASSMYEREGFKVVSETPVDMWGRTLTEKKYVLTLTH